MTEPYDLRSFFAALGGVSSRKVGLSDDERKDTTATVELLDDQRTNIKASPLEVQGYVDGVQASSCIAYYEHRPVHLVYVGAACVSPQLQPVTVTERLEVVCSHVDAGALEKVSGGIPVVALAEDDPMALERLVRAHVDLARERCEASVVDDLSGTLPVVVDGDLRARGGKANLVGVAKTLRTRYLPDESVLLGLPKGWRSPRFSINDGQGVLRYSCYVRLTDHSDQAWSHGLVRLESYDADVLEPLAALCLTQTQGHRSGDRRFDVHLAPVRACEDMLRARRPAAFMHL